MEKTMWNGFGYLPRHRGSSIWAIFFQLRGSGSLESKMEQLFSRRLFIMQRKRPAGEKPTSWPGEKILLNATSECPQETGFAVAFLHDRREQQRHQDQQSNELECGEGGNAD